MKKQIMCGALVLALGVAAALPSAAVGQGGGVPAGDIGRFAEAVEARAEQLAITEEVEARAELLTMAKESEFLGVHRGAWRYAQEVPCSHAAGEMDLLQIRAAALLYRAADGHTFTIDAAETRIYCRHDGVSYSQVQLNLPGEELQ